MFNWLKRLLGGSDSSTASESAQPAMAPEPAAMPSEPAAEPSADAGEAADEPAGDEPA